MRILHQDPLTGEIRVRADSVDDLWHLSHIVEPGDVAVAITWRTPEEAAKDKLRASKLEKKPMLLGVKVQTIEFHASTNRLRLLGTIVEGPQEHGAHHTINVEPMGEVTIRKERWTVTDQERLREAVEATKRPLVTFLAVEDDSIVVALLRQYGVVKAAEVAGHVPGKRYAAGGQIAEAREAFFAEGLEALRQQRGDGPLVVLGPGFWKDRFLEYARSKDAEAVRGAVVENTAHAGMPGVTEAIRRGAVERVQERHRAATEVVAVEELLERLGRDEPATYGEEHVARALELGAVSRLLVADDRVRSGGVRLLDLARATGAETVLVSAESEVGRKLASLGGYAAILRYRLPE